MMNEKLGISINVLSNMELDSEELVVEKLILLGFDRIEAEKYAVLVPLAFARIFLENQGVLCTNYVCLRDEKGEWIQRDLNSSHIFTEAKLFAQNSFARKNDTEMLLAIGARSWDATIALEQLSAGKDIRGAKLSDTMLVRIALKEWDGDL